MNLVPTKLLMQSAREAFCIHFHPANERRAEDFQVAHCSMELNRPKATPRCELSDKPSIERHDHGCPLKESKRAFSHETVPHR